MVCVLLIALLADTINRDSEHVWCLKSTSPAMGQYVTFSFLVQLSPGIALTGT